MVRKSLGKKSDIHITCTEYEKTEIEKKAVELGMTVSQLSIYSILYPERLRRY